MRDTPKKSTQKSTQYNFCSFSWTTFKLVNFELKIPDLLSSLKYIYKLNKIRIARMQKHKMNNLGQSSNEKMK